MRRLCVVVTLVAVAGACQRAEDKRRPRVLEPSAGSGSAVGPAPQRARAEQIAPPLDLKNPPLDAITTRSGLIYKKLVVAPEGLAAGRNDTVSIQYTGWRQATGETFFTNRGGQPMALPLANTAPGFTEAMQLVRKGEKAVLWIPPSIGYKGTPPPGTSETLVYEVEVVDIAPAPAIPSDVGAPPPDARALPSGIKFAIVRDGTGKDRAKYYDLVTFNYSAWDDTGRMFDTTELRKRPATVPPFRQTPAMEEILTSMTAGQRARFWVDATRMQQSGKPLPGMPEGILTYEVELISITKNHAPWPVPPDVKAPPANAVVTPKGVAKRVLRAGKGETRPTVTDTVRVHYTGWTTDGRMFDSSVIKGQPAEFVMSNVIAGWTDAIPTMRVGERARLWIPDSLAYKGAPGKPQGTLVFDVELLEVVPPSPPAEPATAPAAPPPKAP